MKIHTIACAVALCGVAATQTAIASDLAPNFTTTAAGQVTHSTTPANPGITQGYGDTFTSPTTVIPGSGTPGAGFFDDYLFTITGSDVDSVTSTLSLLNVSAISNLQVRLFNYALNTTLPVTTTPNGTYYDAAWTTTPVGGGASLTVDVLSPIMLAAGTYVLQVKGNVTGTGGGSYSGTLNVSPVPLPAALPLLLCGLGMFGGAARRKLTA